MKRNDNLKCSNKKRHRHFTRYSYRKCRYLWSFGGLFRPTFMKYAFYCFSCTRPRFPQLCSRWTPVMRASGSVHVLLRYTIAELRARWDLQERTIRINIHRFANLLGIDVIIFNVCFKSLQIFDKVFVINGRKRRETTVFWSGLQLR